MANLTLFHFIDFHISVSYPLFFHPPLLPLFPFSATWPLNTHPLTLGPWWGAGGDDERRDAN